jgi:Tol biopolymer transport system component
MRRLAAFAGALLLALAGSADAQAPEADIYLAPLSRVGDSLVVGRALNVTRRAGYDNQPAFLPDGSAILYTATSDGQADIWRYDIATRRKTRVTNTPESEYSPTIMPGGKRFSAIRVERDSTQRLWSFALDGSDPQLVLNDLKPVGYHAWLGSTRLAAFVLGTPPTLHVINRDGSNDVVRARDVGRAVQVMPPGEALSFTRRDSTNTLWVILQTVADPHEAVLVQAAPDNEFHTWTPEGTLLTASNSVLLRWDGKQYPRGSWLPVANLAMSGVKNVSRLAVSPDGRWLAFVAEPATP